MRHLAPVHATRWIPVCIALLGGGISCGGGPAGDGGPDAAHADATVRDGRVPDGAGGDVREVDGVVAVGDAAVDVVPADTGSAGNDVPVAPVCVARTLRCLDGATSAVCNDVGTGWAHTTSCAAGTHCESGACVGPIAWHLRNAVDLQFVQGRDADDVAACTSPQSGDLICGVDASMHALRPRFGQFFASTWFTLDAASADPCVQPATAHACIARKLRSLADRWTGDNPHLVLAGILAEMVAQGSVPASAWPSICRAGSMGQWGANTCVPDVEHSAAARDYLVGWGQAFVDGGVRAMMFGETYLMTGTGAAGGHSISYTGAAGLGDVVTRIRAYGAAHGMPTMYFAGQATSSVKTSPSGPELMDFVEGAEHLEVDAGFLLQPLLPSGSFVAGRYGAGDGHEANLVADGNGLPVLLDYDNWSGRPDFPDDIRLLAQVGDNAARARVLRDHWHHLRLYNPRASLSIPVSKTLGDNTGITCMGVSRYQFASSPCGLDATAAALFAEPDGIVPTAAAGDPAAPIRPAYWGQQLRGRDETVSWYYLAFLGRRASTGEYAGAVSGLPTVMAADDARCTFAQRFVDSAEFTARGLSDTDYVAVVMRALLLREPDAGGSAYFAGQIASGSRTRGRVLQDVCHSAEATGLYAAH